MEKPAGRTDPLLGGGEMGALMRSIDWSRTAVGAPSTWPQSLRTALSILLETGFPMYIAWGPEFTQFYNDGYRPILGSTKHPAAMGLSTRVTFAEIWEIIGPMFQGVMGGTATTVVDFLLPIDRHGFVEECYFIFSYSPIREESGGVGGVLVTVTETTERVLGARRLKTLQELAARMQRAATAEAACEVAANVLGENPADLPFALLYLLDAGGRTATLAGAAGIEPDAAAAPPRIDLGGFPLWPLAAVLATGAAQILEELPEAAGSLPAQRAAVIPIAQPGEERPTGALVAAISPRLMLDEKYLSFLELAASQIATAVANVRALAEAVARRREIEAARNLLESVVKQMPAGVIIAEAPSGCTLMANERVRSILGAPALPTRSIEDFAAYTAVHPDGRAFRADEYALTRALAGKVVLDEEIHYLRPDGTRRILSASAGPVYDSDGRIIAAVNAFSDITDRKNVEEHNRQLLVLERQARADAEVASRSKDEFLAMLGHELRNPLAPIVTALQLMRLRGDETLVKERTVIERQVHHLIRLVDDLLDVSRITRGKIELKRERIELSEIVAKAIEMASPLIEQRRHQLAVDVPRQGLAVDADAVRMAQVVANLLNNAAKYTEPNGSLLILAERDGDAVVLRVRDTGIGLSAEMLPRIFDLFVQERQAIDRAQGGLGLGLAIVRVLVELHGGTVEARSEGHGKGAELIVRLPAAEAGDRPAPVSPPHAEVGIVELPDAVRVLVVDDNLDAAELLATSVQMMGHAARVAHDGPAGLRIAAEFRPDVALIDIGLPVMDGYELARHLRALPGLESVRLIAVTGYSQEADRAEAAAAGFEQHLVKPIRLEQLQPALAAAKERSEP
jgi:PAS domain S-box-containing protein